VEFSGKIHNFLKANRKDYNAEKWSDINKSESEEKWAVKIPDDFQKWPVKLIIDSSVKAQITKYPENWKYNNLTI
jgi:hypothetical protein